MVKNNEKLDKELIHSSFFGCSKVILSSGAHNDDMAIVQPEAS